MPHVFPPTTQELFLKELLAEYEAKGISTDKIIDTDFFKSLSVAEKTRLLQLYADRLDTGTKTLDKYDRKKLIGAAVALAGAGTAGYLAYSGAKGFTKRVGDAFEPTVIQTINKLQPGLALEEVARRAKDYRPSSVGEAVGQLWRFKRPDYAVNSLGGVPTILTGMGAASSLWAVKSRAQDAFSKPNSSLLKDIIASDDEQKTKQLIRQHFIKQNLPG